MTTEVLIGDGEAAHLMPHPLRAAILGEVHARPFRPISVPSRIVHLAFDTSGTRAQTDQSNLVALCESLGLPAPSPTEKHLRSPFGRTILRWEQQSMNARTRLQMRLQTTVEGLSVAAITYHVVGLFGYLVKAAHDRGRMPIEPRIVTAAFVPAAAFAIWRAVRSIRKKHMAGED
jgi:uncharacterized membrane-anchored protein